MEKLLSLLWTWGIGDSLWLALDPVGWSRFWGRFFGFLGRDPVWPRVMAAVQFAVCAYLLRRGGRKAK